MTARHGASRSHLLLRALLACAAIAGNLHAADADAAGGRQAVNLPAVMRMAGARNLDIRLATERLAEAQARHQAVRMQWFPYATTGIQFRGHDGNIQATDGTIIDARRQSLALGAALTMQLGIGETYYRSLVAQRLGRAAEHGVEVQRQESIWQAVSAYLELTRAHSAVGITAEAVKISKNYAGQVAQAVGAGIAFKGDAFRATAQVGRNQIAHRQAREQQRIAAARLAQVLHISPQVELYPDDTAPAPLTFPGAEKPPADLARQALEQRPEMGMSAEQLAAAISESAGAKWAPAVPALRAEYFTGGLGGGPGDGGARNFKDSSDYAIGLTWRLGPGGLFDPSRKNLADAKTRGAEIERDKLRDEITRQVVEAHTRVRSLADQLAYARKTLEAAEQALKLTGERRAFAVGEVLENILAEQDLTRARLEYLAVVTEHNRAQFLLRRAIGADTQGDTGRR